MNKPFNPLLGELIFLINFLFFLLQLFGFHVCYQGETYEYIDKKNGFVVVCEQVSHHPPVSAFHVKSNNYTHYGSIYPKLKFWGKSIEVKPEGGKTLHLKTTNETYTWSNVNCCVHNIIVGKLWFEQVCI